ncbi:MAG: hypothetical protein JWQ38_1666 [Flavipsychrobacter sp.]|nr:hypothetical protein [Flavipsychrobacter sp.]
MHRSVYFILFFSTIFFASHAQILPSEGSRLNYRLIGFSFPATGKQAGKYAVEIAAGYYNAEDSFAKNIIKTLPGKQNKLITEVPWWGSDYTWRIATSTNKKNELHHFSTGAVRLTDTNARRLRVIHPADKYKDAYVFLDGNKALYDMNGHAVWYLPVIEGTADGDNMRDMKLTKFGTITFIDENKAIYEIDYNGHILWKGPDDGVVSGQKKERYNHGFTRLNNGHYMVIGTRDTVLPMSLEDKPDNLAEEEVTVFGTLIEYDERGKVVWSWKAMDYLLNSDVIYRKFHGVGKRFYAHANGFYVDEDKKEIYLSFRDISRIIKIKYPEGTVTATYGQIYKQGAWEVGNPFFCRQHSPEKNKKGQLYLFNNGCDVNTPPRVAVFEESATEPGGLKSVWEYFCDADGAYDGKMQVRWLVKGGNVEELPDNSMFVCMGSQISKVFIVSMDKKILWSAAAEEFNAVENRWKMTPQFKGDIITSRADLERLIWNSEQKK